MSNARIFTILFGLLLCLLLASNVCAIEIYSSTAPAVLASALLGSNAGIVITSSTLVGCSDQSAVSSGTYTNVSGVYGVGPGVVLSTGNALLAADNTFSDLSYSYGVAASEETNALLAPITGSAVHYDCTRLDIVFDLLPGYDGISINTVFGSEEYPRYQFTGYNDGLGIFINGVNIALSDNSPLNISNRDVSYIPGTGLNGLLAPGGVPLLSFSTFLGNGASSNHLTIIIADASDSILDTVAYVGDLHALAIPEPSSMVVVALMSGYSLLAGLRCRRLR